MVTKLTAEISQEYSYKVENHRIRFLPILGISDLCDRVADMFTSLSTVMVNIQTAKSSNYNET